MKIPVGRQPFPNPANFRSARRSGGISAMVSRRSPPSRLLARVDGSHSGCMNFRSTVTQTDRIRLAGASPQQFCL